MKNYHIIGSKFQEAVAGLNPEWFETGDSEWYDYIVTLKKELRLTYLVITFNNQVNNGGFHQYFSNGYGQFYLETINALESIGARRKGKLLLDAYKEVNVKNYSDPEFREKLLNHDIEKLFNSDDLFDPLEKLDDKYYDCEEDIEALLVIYLGL